MAVHTMTRDEFIRIMNPLYRFYHSDFRYTGGIKRTINGYINSKYPDSERFMGIFRRRLFFDDKILMCRKDKLYFMILANAFTIHRFLKFYEYVVTNSSCKLVCIDFMLEYFSINNGVRRALLDSYLEGNTYERWNDTFGFQNQLLTILKPWTYNDK